MQYGGQAKGGIMAGGGSIGCMPPTKEIALENIVKPHLSSNQMFG